eukprot:GILJ01009165.1.p1 GENE.GILJ01009165.1~~GILJ01009165.1.p1  ORF type:complete len:1352 (+),score=315.80 GILJ01009165.1:74-4057(+)
MAADDSTMQVNGEPTNATQDGAQNETGDAQEFISIAAIRLEVVTPLGETIPVEALPTDNFADLKQYLTELIPTCYFTSYHFELNGEKLNDFVEVQSLEGLAPNTKFVMVNDAYNEKSARQHLRRLKQILEQPPIYPPTVFDAPKTEATDKQPAVDTSAPAVEAPSADAPAPSQDGKDGESSDAKTGEKASDNTPTGGNAGKNKKNKKKKSKKSKKDEKDKQQNSNAEEDAGKAVPALRVESATLNDYFNSPTYISKDVIQCLISIGLSGWNPPTGNRKLQGDLLYLQVRTLENQEFHITSHTNHFFINETQSSHTLKPQPSSANPCFSHTLVGLLEQISPLFKQKFAELINPVQERDPFAHLPLSYQNPSWLAPKDQPATKYQVDLARVEESVLNSYGLDPRGVLRDWNEEFQCCKELPHETLEDRLHRDRAMFKVHSDFVEAATQGARAVVDQKIAPINPMDAEKAFVYVFNNIFFSYAVDSRDVYKEAGGDTASQAFANHDLRGVKQMYLLDIDGLHTLGTILIDFHGYRIVAQSIIPGILQGENSTTVAYGSVDQGVKILYDDDFHALMCDVAKKLHLEEHSVIDGAGEQVKTAAAVECKGIIGTDKRKYVLDLLRTTPRDANYLGDEYVAHLLRPELVETFIRGKQLSFIREYAEKYTKEQKEKKAQSDKPEAKEEKAVAEGTDEQKTAEGEETTMIPVAELQEALKSAPVFVFNPNVFTPFKVAMSDEERKAAEDRVKELSDYLLNTVIPRFILDALTQEVSPTDSVGLSEVFHQRGINMRYLGRVSSIAHEKHLPHIREVCDREAVVRAAKCLLRGYLRDTPQAYLAAGVAHFLNTLLGSSEVQSVLDGKQAPVEVTNSKSSTKGKPTAGNRSAAAKAPAKPAFEVPKVDGVPLLNLTPSSLWNAIRELANKKYGVKFPASQSDCKYIFSVSGKHSLVKGICKAVGVQLVTKAYEFESNLPPFSAEHICDLFPVVKHINPNSADARDKLDSGKRALADSRYDLAYDGLSQALMFYNQSSGPMHKETAQVYSSIAMIFYRLQDFAQAIFHQDKAVVIYERVVGLDHPETAHNHGNLALFHHAVGNVEKAFQHMQRCLYLLELFAGPYHPDTNSTYLNLAMMYQDLGHFHIAIQCLTEALRRSERLWGPDHYQVAACHNAIALTFAAVSDYRQALFHERNCYAILQKRYGDNDARTKESVSLMEQFTRKAVELSVETTKRIQEAIAHHREQAAMAPPAAASKVSALSSQERVELLRRLRMAQAQNARGRGVHRNVNMGVSESADEPRMADANQVASAEAEYIKKLLKSMGAVPSATAKPSTSD